MRSFLTFLSIFAIFFFLLPTVCLSRPEQTVESERSAVLPERIRYGETDLPTADLLVGRLAYWDLRGYHPQALQAAAVAACTELYTLYRETGTADGFEVLSAEQAKEKWGDYWFSVYWREMQSAVRETWGKTLSEPAPVFALSWGQTAAGVECPYDFTADGFETEIEVPLSRLRARLPDCETSLTVKKARNNRVQTVTSGRDSITGEEAMRLFSLPSLCFSVYVGEKSAVFRCLGQGDGEGMSLYGANEWAKRGVGYREILARFYPTAEIRE